MKKSLLLMLALPAVALARPPTEVDPEHFKVLMENECVRVLRVTFGPGEQAGGAYDAVPGLTVPLTDVTFERTKDAETKTYSAKRGEVYWVTPGHVTSLTNKSDKPVELIAVIPKGPCR